METKDFDNKFSKITTEMVEVAFEYVDYNKQEIDTIYIYSSMENNSFFYNVFYCINGQLTKLHKINDVSKKQYDLSVERVFRLLRLGNEYLLEVRKLFIEDKREVPTQMKMMYFPKTGKFTVDISYELYWSNSKELLSEDIFRLWYEEINKVMYSPIINN
jgi:hypothetical protein